ncbi:hypothetical protein FRC03_007255 [Tulasnella sp. 419]|nr:hypothetical protein FRC03_007255 [Tulasnella sp. 419]
MRFFSLLTVTVALAAPALSLTLPWKSKPYDNVHIDLVDTSNQIKKQLEALPAQRAEPIYAKTKKLVVKLAKVTKQDLDQSVKGQALFPEINRMATYVQTLGEDVFDPLNKLGIKVQKSTDNVTADEVIAALRTFRDSIPDLSLEKQQELLQTFAEADDLVEDS